MANGGGGGSIGTVLLVLLVLGALGAWNYNQNYQTELSERGRNAFASYDDASLEGLRAAYQSEIDALMGEYTALRTARTNVRKTTGVGDGVQQFERAQNTANRLRDATTEVATREARIREIDDELARRRAGGDGMLVHLKRLTGLPLPI